MPDRHFKTGEAPSSGYARNIVRAMAYPAMALSAERRIIVSNTAARSLFDDELAGKDFVRVMRHPDALECIDRVIRSRLVGDLLSLAKLEAKEHVAPDGAVDIQRVIQSVVASLEASDADYPNRVKVNVLSDLRPVAGSEDELIEVFQNLIENALKYSTPTTPVTVNIFQRPSATPGGDDRQIVMIEDQGEGMERKHLSRLTERFYRVDKGRSREMGGTGLGLAITKHILNRHRGRMSIDSKVGEGTRVKVILNIKP